MKQLTLTIAADLLPGDMFRRVKFRTEIVYTVTTNKKNADHILAIKDGLHWPDPISKKEEVIFINHKTT